MNIVLLEDDGLYTQWLATELEKAFGERPLEIATEREFRTRFADFERSVPHLFIIDVMVRWTDPAPNMSPPPEDARDHHRAGIRCLKLLRESEATRSVPVFLLSALDEDDLRHAAAGSAHWANVHVVQKGQEIIAEIRTRVRT
jgi:DNA-binding response OmpR family regulator